MHLGIIIYASGIIGAIGLIAYWGRSPTEIMRRNNNAENTRGAPKVNEWTYIATFGNLICLL